MTKKDVITMLDEIPDDAKLILTDTLGNYYHFNGNRVKKYPHEHNKFIILIV